MIHVLLLCQGGGSVWGEAGGRLFGASAPVDGTVAVGEGRVPGWDPAFAVVRTDGGAAGPSGAGGGRSGRAWVRWASNMGHAAQSNSPWPASAGWSSSWARSGSGGGRAGVIGSASARIASQRRIAAAARGSRMVATRR